MQTKSIFAVSLDSANRHRAAATLMDGTRLFITHCVPIAGRFEVWRDSLRAEIEEKAANGFAVIIEDRSGRFSPYASCLDFADVEDGATMLQHALAWWFSLEHSGNLILDPAVTRFAMRSGEGGNIEIKSGDRGSFLYQPDWNQFHGGHKALLLCVIAAMMEDPFSDRHFQAMIAAFPKMNPEPKSILERWSAAFQEMAAATSARHEAVRLAREEMLKTRDGADA